MLFLYEQNIIIYTYGALCGLGCIVRLIVSLAYKRFIKESDNIGATSNKQLKHMKLKFETCYRLKIGVNNVDTFVDKNVLRYKSSGFLLSTWETIGGQILYLCLLLVPIFALFGVVANCGQDLILLNGSVGILASAVLIFVDKGLDLPVKKKMVRMNLMDYLENFCKVRLEQEVFHPEQLEQYRSEYFKQTGIQVGQANTKEKDQPKDELNRRREARRKKEEEKRALALKREEEQKRIEELRKEEERIRMEERKRLAAKRREEERLRMEEERLALEARRIEAKKKAEEKQQIIELKRKKAEEKQQVIELKRREDPLSEEKLLDELEESKSNQESMKDEREKEKEELLLEQNEIIQAVQEVAADIEPEESQQVKAPSLTMVHKSQGISPSEEKLIEDILKDFFA